MSAGYKFIGYSAVLTAVLAAIAGCESPFASADRDAYRLVDQRQRETLGSPSQSTIGTTELNTVRPEAYEKTPGSTNTLSPELRKLLDTPTASDTTTPRVNEIPNPNSTQPATRSSTDSAGPTTQPLAALRNPYTDMLRQQGFVASADAPEAPVFPRPLPKGQTRKVYTLADCFNQALTGNRDYRSRKEDLYLAALDVTLARHQFEPRLFAQSTVGPTGHGEGSDYETALTATQTVGVRQKLPYGGEIIASFLAGNLNQLRSTVGDSTSAQAILEARIPLLKGAGLVAQEDLIQSERNLIYAVRDFERYRRSFLVSVAGQYFNLVNQRAQIVNRLRSARSYTFMRRRSEALFQAGRQSLLDVQRAAQSELSANNDLITVIENYELAVDNFKILLGVPMTTNIDVAPEYLLIKPPQPDEAAAVATGLNLRLDLQTQRDRIGDSERQVALAKNNLLPNLDLTAKVASSSDATRRSLAPQWDNLDYSAAVVLDLPLDKVSERNDYRASLVYLERSRRSLQTAEETATLQIRLALRLVRQQLSLLRLQANNIEMAQRRKDFSDIQFRDGKINNRDYLEAESALLDAQNRFAQALANLQVASLQYLRDTDLLRVTAEGKLILPEEPLGASTQLGAIIPATQPK